MARSRLEDEDDDDTVEVKPKPIDAKIDEELLKARRLFFSHVVDMASSHEMIRKLWYLELIDPGKPILMVINSPGGSIDAGFAIYDQVGMISSPVSTLVTGFAASMGSVLALCAPRQRRYATCNARFMIHQPRIMGRVQGPVTDLSIQAEEILKSRRHIVALYVKETGKTEEEIEKALDRDLWLSAQEALKFNLIGKIVSSFQDIK